MKQKINELKLKISLKDISETFHIQAGKNKSCASDIPDKNGVKDLRRKILILAVICCIALAADIISAFTQNTIKISRDKSGITMTRTDKTGHISLKARVKSKDADYEDSFEISLYPYENPSESSGELENEDGAEINERDQIESEVRDMVMSLNDDTSSKKILLPSTLPGGQKVSWSVIHSTHSALILFASLCCGFLIYHSRQIPLKKKRKSERASVSKNLPEFINRLVLLLNAGLVLNTAFERSIDEGIRFQNYRKSEDFFWTKMNEINISVKETNSSPNREFLVFARQTGMTEMLRISNIISDNISKGAELTEKLYSENEILWMNKKRECEERGRISETKLTLPLTLFLLVLVIITVSPALLEL